MADAQHRTPQHTLPPHGDAAHAGGHAHDPLASEHLIGHVKDSTYFELPRFLGGKWNIPQLRAQLRADLSRSTPASSRSTIGSNRWS